MKELYRQLKHYLKEKDRVSSAVIYQGPLQGFQFLWQEDRVLWASHDQTKTAQDMLPALKEVKSASTCQVKDNHVFVEHFGMRPRLVVLGGGHISLSLVKLGKLLDFHITVADDRKEFANKDRFPQADCILCGDFSEIFKEIPDLPANYYVVVTRGHKGDSECIRQILSRKYAYAGMIGSKTKVARTKKTLCEEGFDPEQIDAIHAPIGLKIGAVTPEEIAVCIAAEIIQEKNAVPTESIDDAMLDLLCSEERKTLALIVAKTGSAPRPAGARMVVRDHKILAGTIGGGAIEHAAILHGSQMPQKQIKTDVQEFILHPKEGANLGMICGGINVVYFENE